MSPVKAIFSKPSPVLQALAIMAVCMLLPAEAFAQVADGGLTLVTGLGCKFVSLLRGPMAIVVFLVVCVATIFLGMVTKMDWAKIFGVVILLGILQGIVTILASTGMLIPAQCLS